MNDKEKGDIIKKHYKDAILIGNHILNKNNWTTQIPHRLCIATNITPKNDLDFCNIYFRPKEWFEKISSEIIKKDFSSYNIESLPPSLCLADLILYKEHFHGLHIDDYEIPDEDKEDFKRACKTLTIPENICDEWLNYYNTPKIR
jgi:hypothetical protein